MERLHVACAAEGAYVGHSAAMLRSVLVHGEPAGVHAHYLHGSHLPASDARALAGMFESYGARIDFIRVAEHRVKGLPPPSRFTSAMWFRLFLPELLTDVERVLYLDVDTIATDALGPLWRTDLEGRPIGAVTNVFQANHAHRPAQLGLTGPGVYFNSGVLLLDLAAWRRDRLGPAVLECVRSRGAALEWPDQDALNLVLSEHRHPLHPRWNCMNSLFLFPWSDDVFALGEAEDARQHPGIRHFEGPDENKPWHAQCEQPLSERYALHRAATPWPEWTPSVARTRTGAAGRRRRLRGLFRS